MQRLTPNLPPIARNRLRAAALFLTWLSTTSYIANTVTIAADASSATKPSSEMEKLASSVGVWHTQQQYRAAPGVPVFNSTSTETARWSADHQFLIVEQHGTAEDGVKTRIVVVSWNSLDHSYHMIEVSAGGATNKLTMTIEGNIHKVVGHRYVGTRLVRSEAIVEITSPNESKFRTTCLDSDSSWTCSEGTSTRAK